MIFVTLGTHGQPMNRLLRALDGLVESAAISGPIIVQSAAIDYVPRHAEVIGIIEPGRLTELMSEADVVITHGGPGSILGALATGRRPVVVPRQAAAGEHVDDHQVRFAAWFRERRDILVVMDIEDLLPAIRESVERGRQAQTHGPAPETVRRVAELLDS